MVKAFMPCFSVYIMDAVEDGGKKKGRHKGKGRSRLEILTADVSSPLTASTLCTGSLVPNVTAIREREGRGSQHHTGGV